MNSRDLLNSFTDYCHDHPSERFWQALRNWAGVSFIWASSGHGDSASKEKAKDTFYWQARNGQSRSVDAE
jgi:hypothetical protein